MTSIPSLRQNLLLAALAFGAVFIVGFCADLVLVRYPRWMLLDDLILSLAAAIIVFRYERERSRFLSEKVRVIREMNAFVRNELQILYATALHPENKRIATLERSLDRIDWALRELLPGRETPQPASLPDSQKDLQRSA
jgi:hypothetical protein